MTGDDMKSKTETISEKSTKCVFAGSHSSCLIIYLVATSCKSNKWSTTQDKSIIQSTSQTIILSFV